MRVKMQAYTSSAIDVLPRNNAGAERTGTDRHIRAALFIPTRIDYIFIGLIVIAVLCVLALVSPARTFSVTDDWCYAQSVDALLKGAYRPHEFSMATALGHVLWGGIFHWIMGAG